MPRALFRWLLPRSEFVRLFHADANFKPGDFYDAYPDECRSAATLRLSSERQVVDQFAAIDVALGNKRVLNIRGGHELALTRLPVSVGAQS